MSAKILDGKSIAARIRQEVKADVIELGFSPGLGVILVGDDKASHLYVSLKEKACAAAGIRFEKKAFPATATRDEVIAAIRDFNVRPDIDAILVQLPLPHSLDPNGIIAAMEPAKDVDGFHPLNIAALRAGAPLLIPGLSASIMELIATANLPLNGKHALVIGNSETFYAPLETVLAGAGMIPTYRHPDAKELRCVMSQSDVVIVAIGKPGFVTGDMLMKGAIVIDVGTNKVDERTVGDVDADSAADVAGFITPVPGGVGPVTVAMLLRNVVVLARKRSHR